MMDYDYLNGLSEEELYAEIDKMSAHIDEYYNERKKEIRERANRLIGRINEDFKLFNEKQLFEFMTAIEDMDYSAANTMMDSIENLNRRGALDSGIMTRVAQDVMEARIISEERAEKIKDFESREMQNKKDRGIEDLELQEKYDVRDLEYNRAVDKSRERDSIENSLRNLRAMYKDEEVADETSVTDVQQNKYAKRADPFNETDDGKTLSFGGGINQELLNSNPFSLSNIRNSYGNRRTTQQNTTTTNDTSGNFRGGGNSAASYAAYRRQQRS